MQSTKQQPANSIGENITAIMIGLVNALILVLGQFSLAALIFQDQLLPFYSVGAGYMLLGSALTTLLVAGVGAFRNAITLSQDNPVVILSAGIMLLVQDPLSQIAPEALFVTVMVIIILCAWLTSLTLWIFAQNRWGVIIKYIPYPIIGGILAATGWLLVKGAIGIMAQTDVRLLQLWTIFDPALLLRWLPGIVMAFLLVILIERVNHVLVLPAIIVTALIAFYAVIALTATPLTEARDAGWLIRLPQTTSMLQPIPIHRIGLVQWQVVSQHFGVILTVVLITVISALMNITAIESAYQKNIDMNREMKITALANIVAGLVGSLPNYHSVSKSTFALKSGVNSYLSAVTVSLVTLLIVGFGADFMVYVPVFILGGLLAFIGLTFLYDWGYLAARRLSTLDFMVIVIIVITVELSGFLTAIAVGLLLSTILFAIDYSQVETVKFSATGRLFHSDVRRNELQTRVLEDHGDAIWTIWLRGYLFFGSAAQLYQQIEQRLNDADLPPLQAILFSFEQVVKVDSSAANEFTKINRLASDHGVHVYYAALSESLRQFFDHQQSQQKDSINADYYPTLNDALIASENRLLESQQIDPRLTTRTISAVSSADNVNIALLYAYGQKVEHPENTILFEAGQPADALYFIESGIVKLMPQAQSNHYMGRNYSPGMFIGYEVLDASMPMYEATAITQDTTRVLKLPLERWQKVQHDHPKIANKVLRLVLQDLAGQVGRQQHMIDRLI